VALGDHDKGSEQQQGNKFNKSFFFNIFSLFYINLYFHLDFKIGCIHMYTCILKNGNLPSSKFDFLNDIDIVFVHKCNNLIIKMFNS
jgi:hypothetical protein